MNVWWFHWIKARTISKQTLLYVFCGNFPTTPPPTKQDTKFPIMQFEIYGTFVKVGACYNPSTTTTTKKSESNIKWLTNQISSILHITSMECIHACSTIRKSMWYDFILLRQFFFLLEPPFHSFQFNVCTVHTYIRPAFDYYLWVSGWRYVKKCYNVESVWNDASFYLNERRKKINTHFSDGIDSKQKKKKNSLRTNTNTLTHIDVYVGKKSTQNNKASHTRAHTYRKYT